MPPTTRRDEQRQLDAAIVKPQRVVRAVATSQQGGYSGQIPGTTSDPTQVAIQFSTIQQYPPSAPSPNGDQVAGVGHAVLNNAGNPVVVMGNLNATQTSGTDLPSNFQDGGFAFLDAAGNAVAGYSQPTGLWGFGGASKPTILSAGAFIGPLWVEQFGIVNGGFIGTPKDSWTFDAVTVDANTTFTPLDGSYMAPMVMVSSERCWTAANTGGTPPGGTGPEMIPAGSSLSFAMLSIGPTPDLVSITVEATSLDGTEQIFGNWHTGKTGTATWVSTATRGTYGLMAGGGEVVGQPLCSVLNLSVALSSPPYTSNKGTSMSFQPSGMVVAGTSNIDNSSGYISVPTAIDSPLQMQVRTSAYWYV